MWHVTLCILRFLAQGGSLQSLAWEYRVGKSTACNIVRDTCEAIWEVMCPIYVKAPTARDWTSIAKGFWETWNMPNCLGAIDGKHVKLQCPKKAGSVFFNYKHSHSIVLMAVCNDKYEFTMVDIGAQGSQNDGGVFANSAFGQKLNSGGLGIPAPCVLPNSMITFPYYFVGDEAFPLKENLMRPFPGRFLDTFTKVFNYRLSRARRVIENSFGILASRWRIFHSTINASPETTETYVKASICLHNYIMRSNASSYTPVGFVDSDDGPGRWRDELPAQNALQTIQRVGANLSAQRVYALRNELRDYLNLEGEVEWQREFVMRGYLAQ